MDVRGLSQRDINLSKSLLFSSWRAFDFDTIDGMTGPKNVPDATTTLHMKETL
ncbi:hypothetical protein TGAM01_v208041 [Trichoderma gamsii]|uniref:Uncharacterized protein n=1 Tax=Trichoderma gamsii TaxID=398673 RepID=A0A2P4ZFG8_9HYPO|nr:hypothetical protein TGAM01_v208041 [Trichoderma gamsii]PON23035.1 hypothetical protein TGAM01_v208041 [Trichoderma gamsii]